MSYDISLRCNHCEQPMYFQDITYNYAKFFSKVIDNKLGIRKIYGMTGTESIKILNKAIDKLKNDYNENYWTATEGNAKKALIKLRNAAEEYPNLIWFGD